MGEPNISTVRTDHEFGGVSTDLKLALVENYLRAFTQALRPRFNDLWYIDAFAGTGERTVRRAAREADLVDLAVEEQLERRRGSARIAVDIEPRFDRLVFIDTNRRHVRALKEIRDTNPGRKIDVYRREANAGILDLISGHKFAGTRAVMFLDPYGMHVEWATLQAVQRTEAIDVWYLVSLEGLFRQAAKDAGKITENKRKSITRMLGTPDWEADWYRAPAQDDLFGNRGSMVECVADVDAIESYVGNRLRTVFPKVLPPLRLRNRANVPSFSLFFAISNPKGEAIGLATRIANHILGTRRSSVMRRK